MSKSRWILLAFYLVTLVGCAYDQSYFKLKPTLPTSERVIGQGEKIAVTVTDQRPQPALGVRWLGVGAANKINLASDLAEDTRQQLEHAIDDRGFTAVPFTSKVSRRLFVRLLSYDFDQTLAFLGTTVKVTMHISVTAQNGPNEYTMDYHAEEVQDILPQPENPEAFKQITRVYQKVFAQLLQDPNVWLTFTAKDATEGYDAFEDNA